MTALQIFNVLDKERVRKGLSVRQMCLKAGIPTCTWWGWGRGNGMQTSKLFSVMDVLGVGIKFVRLSDERVDQ